VRKGERARANTGVLRIGRKERALRLEDDGEKQATATATEEADPYGMTNQRSNGNGERI
jgi:hypothetical protein